MCNSESILDSGCLFYQEIFATIQGESTDAGYPCTFIRLFGCDIGCKFCDQVQTSGRKKISLSNVVKKVLSYNIPHVCITGGEPLMQWDVVYPLILELCSYGFKVSVETSGCYPIDPDPYNRSFKYVMDIKCPSSGVYYKNVYDNLMNLLPKDEVKFVISDKKDFDFALKVLSRYPTPAKILFSPCFDKDNNPIIGEELSKWIIQNKLYDARVQIQMHKILGVK